jgi:hypothetical protein
MKTASRWVYALLVVLLECAVSGPSASACDGDAQAGAPPDVKTAQFARPSAGQSGMRAYFDPQTGKIGAPPPEEAAPAAAEQSSYSTSSEGLVVVPAPGGGEMIDLQGRFQTSITATLKPDGTVETDCHPSGRAPAAGVGR